MLGTLPLRGGGLEYWLAAAAFVCCAVVISSMDRNENLSQLDNQVEISEGAALAASVRSLVTSGTAHEGGPDAAVAMSPNFGVS